MSILVINAGSTSLKFTVFDAAAKEQILTGTINWADGNRQEAPLVVQSRGEPAQHTTVAVPDHLAAAAIAIETVTRRHTLEAVGHRVVHGGTAFSASTVVTPRVKETVARLSALAPLHNPPALEAINAAEHLLPGVPQVAVFDTAFFSRLPERAYLYPVPYEWHERYGVRRIGFHGLSHEWCARRAVELLRRDPRDLRLVICHLGGGCSATAVRGGRPVATTMGFTPMEGLMMGTRSGSLDPGVILYLLRQCGRSVDELDHALNHHSGLLGVSGLSADFARIEEAVRAGDARARLAFDLFADRVRAAIGSLAVTQGGLDAVVFTGGIGERSPWLRQAVCDGLECLGARLDPARNSQGQPDADIASPESVVRILVIQTREELLIALEARRVALEAK